MPSPRPPLSKLWAACLGLGILLAGAAGPLRADNDWLDIEVPRPLDDATFGLNLKVSQTERQYWEDGAAFYPMVQNQSLMVQDLLTLNVRADWQVSRRLVLELNAPLVFSEFSPYSGGIVEYYNVNTPGVYESQGLGDLKLGLRGAWRDTSQGFNAGWSLNLIAPSGVSPFSAPSPLAGTGQGRWQILPGFVLGGLGMNWEGWVEGIGRLEAGQQVVSTPQTYLSWRSQEINGGWVAGDNVSLPGGGAWLGPRYGGDAMAGVAYIWYRDAGSRMALAVEGRAHWLSPWTTASGSLGLPADTYAVLTPELQARYGRFSAVAGWQAAYLWAVEEPYAIYGQIIFDLAYAF